MANDISQQKEDIDQCWFNPSLLNYLFFSFHAFKAVIANANFQLEMTKNMSIYEKWSCSKCNYLVNCASITKYFVDFRDILFDLILVYTHGSSSIRVNPHSTQLFTRVFVCRV